MSPSEIRKLQKQLNRLGFGPLDVDGRLGPKTCAAHAEATAAQTGKEPRFKRPAVEFQGASTNWPDNTGPKLRSFYGPAGGPQCTAGKVILPFRFHIAWDLDETVSSFSCHEKVVAPMTGIFTDAVKHYGEAEFRRLGLDLYGGCFNDRPIRGGSRKSTHAWGIAYDADPVRNRLRSRRKAHTDSRGRYHEAAVFARPEYVPFWNIVEGYGATSLGRTSNFDWMHFQFADQV